jgi:hypothetical protein
MWNSQAAGLTNFVYPYAPAEVGNVAEAEAAWGIPTATAVNLLPNTEYYTFEIDINARHTTAADSPTCSGCDQTMCLSFHRAVLHHLESGGFDEEIRSTTANVSWRCAANATVIHGTIDQGGITACAMGQCPTPARRPTWGELKSLYR